jgi:hypothetical protein
MLDRNLELFKSRFCVAAGKIIDLPVLRRGLAGAFRQLRRPLVIAGLDPAIDPSKDFRPDNSGHDECHYFVVSSSS